MKTLEIYTFDKKELDDSEFNTTNIKNNIFYITKNNIANLYLANSKQIIGYISFINNIVKSPNITFNTSIGTIITPNGKLVFNLSYIIGQDGTVIPSAPNDNSLLITDPTYKSDMYTGFNNLKISIQIIGNTGNRILSLEYDNI